MINLVNWLDVCREFNFRYNLQYNNDLQIIVLRYWLNEHVNTWEGFV